jgi:hypothetical protein
VPFIWSHCKSQTIGIATAGMSLGAYYAANAVFKYPDVFKRCYAISGVYDMKRFMDGVHDENFYYNNPVDYLANLSDPWHYAHYASCDIRIVTGTGPYENPEASYQLAAVLRARNIPHALDDWGAQGGTTGPWKTMMRRPRALVRPGGGAFVLGHDRQPIALATRPREIAPIPAGWEGGPRQSAQPSPDQQAVAAGAMAIHSASTRSPACPRHATA